MNRLVSGYRSQSAMEYLMTYGWAILIIAVVLGVLFQLGVFSGSALTPKAAPGSCQVIRLGGQTSIEGECQGQLPQYVASFNGVNSGITIPGLTNFNINTQSYTMCAWADVPAYVSNSYYGPVLVAIHYASSGLTAYTQNPTGLNVLGWLDGAFSLVQGSATWNAWHYYCVAYAGQGSTSRTVYIDANSLGVISSGTAGAYTGYSQIGNEGATCCGDTAIPPYYESNVQIYNTTLSTNDIHALYLEGIGGAPVKIQNLIGWWPLNGNLNDYSGNNYNGQLWAGVSFDGNWSSGYTPP